MFSLLFIFGGKLKKFEILLFFILLFPGLFCRVQGTSTQTGDDAITLPAPGTLMVDSVAGDSITLQWVDNTDNEDTFVLERDTLPGFINPTEMIINANETTYTDAPPPGNIYFYRIKAVNSNSRSAYSNTIYQVFHLNIKITFDFGINDSGYNNIYTIWAENPAHSYHQPMRLGDKLLGLHPEDREEGDTTIQISGVGTAYWQYKYNMFIAVDVDTNTELGRDIDAVSSATPQQTDDPDGDGPLNAGDFITGATLKTSTPAQFTLYFEYNHSRDYNEWFPEGINASGQPAALYAVDIDLADPKNAYQLVFIGWTPRYEITPGMSVTYGLPILSPGELCRETRYITHEKDEGPPVGFGAEITDNTNATASVGPGGIKLEILR